VTPGFRGAIFDVDGVLVDSPHERGSARHAAGADEEAVE
jgi:beta-phosphoglucomutase-like phosphatase (HAD superfamily)